MTDEKLKEIAFTQGWLEGRLQEDLETVKNAEELDKAEIDHRQEMFDAFMIVSNALDNLRRENHDLEIKIFMVRGAVL